MRRSPRLLVAAAFLALAALITLDCLNLIQTEAWADLTQAPHLNAVSRTKDAPAHRTARAGDRAPLAAVAPATVPAPAAAVGLVLALALLVTAPRSARPRFRPRLRAPPALRFSSTRL